MKNKEQINKIINEIDYNPSILKELKDYISKNYQYIIDICFDPIILELSSDEIKYDSYVKKYLNMTYLEYQKIINTNKDRLDAYFNNNPEVINDKNNLYKEQIKKHILKKVWAIQEEGNAAWYARFLLNKYVRINDLDINVKVIDTSEKLTYINAGFNWNSNLSLAKHESAYKEIGVICYDEVENKPIIYVNVANIMEYEDCLSANLYWVVLTCLHEISHATEPDYIFCKENYKNSKDTKLAFSSHDYYNENHDLFNFELNANTNAFFDTMREINNLEDVNLSSKIEPDSNMNFNYIMKCKTSPDKDKISSLFDETIKNDPSIVREGAFILEYNWNGTKRSMNEYFDILFTHAYCRELDIPNAKKNNYLLYELINHITYNIISQYNKNDFNEQITIFKDNDKLSFIEDALLQAKKELDQDKANLDLLKHLRYIQEPIDLNKTNNGRKYV